MKNYLSKIKEALFRTRENFSLLDNPEVTWDDIEESLILADLGPEVVERVLEEVKHKIGENSSSYAIKLGIKNKLKEILDNLPEFKIVAPEVILLVGVNGSGKTTTAAKLANVLKNRGRVLLVAADTFRAAARDQLRKLARLVDVDYFGGEEFDDPAAVGFEAAKKPYDFIIIDTAGRLHTKENLMKEAVKIKRSVEKASGKTPKVFLILDGTIGQNSIYQAEEFSKALRIDGIIITKLDGTAKGGALVPIALRLNAPILYIGIGERIEDLVPFDASTFVEALFGA